MKWNISSMAPIVYKGHSREVVVHIGHNVLFIDCPLFEVGFTVDTMVIDMHGVDYLGKAQCDNVRAQAINFWNLKWWPAKGGKKP